MRELPAQELNSLDRPMIVGGLVGGILLGMLCATVLFSPGAIWTSEDTFMGNMMQLLEWGIYVLGLSGLLGLLASLAPVSGALLALRLAFQRGPFPSAGCQISLAGTGALLGGLISAFGLGLFFFGNEYSANTLPFLGGIVGISSLGAMAVVYLTMRRRAKENGEPGSATL